MCWLVFRRETNHGVGMFMRSIAFILIFASGTLLLELSSDVLPVWTTVLKKIGIKKEELNSPI